ncbi:MAG: alanine/ornithine racemase family PLP-dependent enzyme [Proteobacteria bacterium]|nr:alanine/ornithine racemase family PLP-dependent enzyme [Pseudomonadota bacterium]
MGDSRIENIERMRRAHIKAFMHLIRSPMPSQVDRVVRLADTSFNTELTVIRQLSLSATQARVRHGIVLMVELGDLREGIMPADLDAMVRVVLQLPNITLRGIGTNLACHSGVSPDANNMSELSALAKAIETSFGISLELVSGGNSANLDWALGNNDIGRINHLRLGESILLGCEPLHRKVIAGLHTDAITLVAEVIEAKTKPSRSRGTIAQTAFGAKPVAVKMGESRRAILAIGCQDIDPAGLTATAGTRILGASGDHLVVNMDSGSIGIGDEMRFGLNYSALTRAMTSPFVHKETRRAAPAIQAVAGENQPAVM